MFPTIQTCEQGEAAWIEVPADGQDGDELELPAPAFVLTAADGGGHDSSSAVDASLRGRQHAARRRGGVERRRRRGTSRPSARACSAPRWVRTAARAQRRRT